MIESSSNNKEISSSEISSDINTINSSTDKRIFGSDSNKLDSSLINPNSDSGASSTGFESNNIIPDIITNTNSEYSSTEFETTNIKQSSTISPPENEIESTTNKFSPETAYTSNTYKSSEIESDIIGTNEKLSSESTDTNSKDLNSGIESTNTNSDLV